MKIEDLRQKRVPLGTVSVGEIVEFDSDSDVHRWLVAFGDSSIEGDMMLVSMCGRYTRSYRRASNDLVVVLRAKLIIE